MSEFGVRQRNLLSASRRYLESLEVTQDLTDRLSEELLGSFDRSKLIEYKELLESREGRIAAAEDAAARIFINQNPRINGHLEEAVVYRTAQTAGLYIVSELLHVEYEDQDSIGGLTGQYEGMNLVGFRASAIGSYVADLVKADMSDIQIVTANKTEAM